MHFSDSMEEKILLLFSGNNWVGYSNVYVTLSSADPKDDGSGLQEPNYVNYARQKIAFNTPSAINGGIGVSNADLITFPQAGTDSATATHIAVYDSLAVGSGNMLMYSKLTVDKPIKADSSPKIYANEGKFWMTGNFSKALKTALFNVIRGTTLMKFTPEAALFTGNPESGGVEVTGGSYARQPITFNTPVSLESEQKVIQNVSAVTFPRATANNGNPDTDAVFDKTTGMLLFFKMQSASSYNMGDDIYYEPAGITLNVN